MVETELQGGRSRLTRGKQSMDSTVTDIMIELHVPDFQVVLDYYQLLGFEVVWMEEDYLVMKKGQSVINFFGGSERVSEHSYFRTFPSSTKRGYAVEIVLPTDDVKSEYERIKERVKIVSPLQKRPWGVWDFRIEDPLGFYIRITDRYNCLHRADKIAETEQ